MASTEQRILLECEARDTLESVRLCTRILRRRPDVGRVMVSTSSYHRLRCTLLFRLAGFDSTALPTASDRPYWAGASGCATSLKELMATPWDAALLLGTSSAVRSDGRSAVTPDRVGYEGDRA